MARNFVRASGQAIQVTTGQLTNVTTQMSFGCWFNPASTPGVNNQHSFMLKTNVGATPGRNYAFDYRTTGVGVTRMELSNTPTAGNFGEWFWNNTYTNNTWHHQLWTVDFSTNPMTVALYSDGVSQTLSTAGTLTGTSGLTTATQQAAIGDTPATGAAFDGMLAELFVVTGALMTLADAKALAQGARTRELLARAVAAGGSIDLYVPLGITGAATEVDFSGKARTFSFTGSPAIANHAPINLFTRSPMGLAPATAPTPPPDTGEPFHPTPFGSFHNFGRMGSS